MEKGKGNFILKRGQRSNPLYSSLLSNNNIKRPKQQTSLHIIKETSIQKHIKMLHLNDS